MEAKPLQHEYGRGMLDCVRDPASHIYPHPHPQIKLESGWGLHLPGMTGRHDLVPREILLPLPGARALLRQETCIPVSEEAAGHSKQAVKRAPFPLLPSGEDPVTTWTSMAALGIYPRRDWPRTHYHPAQWDSEVPW